MHPRLEDPLVDHHWDNDDGDDGDDGNGRGRRRRRDDSEMLFAVFGIMMMMMMMEDDLLPIALARLVPRMDCPSWPVATTYVTKWIAVSLDGTVIPSFESFGSVVV
jgi:hypothetical protein